MKIKLGNSVKKIIPIIIIAVIGIGVFAVFSNSESNQVNEIEQTSVSQKEESIQEEPLEQTSTSKNEGTNQLVESSEITSTSDIKPDHSQPSSVDKNNASTEPMGPIPQQETSKSESTSSVNLEFKQNASQLRAVIIDQLHDEVPNTELHNQATRLLEDAGYQVDLYTTKDITVDFYKSLPSMNYHFILVRTHGGEGNPDEEFPTRLFTGEKYATEKYTFDQLSGQLGYGFPFYDSDLEEFHERDDNVLEHAYFTIGSKLVKEGMKGTFPDSIIIVGGCQSARSHDLMESFIRRGADHVLGWDATVGSVDNDQAMIWLLEDILVNKTSLYDAVEKINQESMYNFEYPTILKLFNAV